MVLDPPLEFVIMLSSVKGVEKFGQERLLLTSTHHIQLVRIGI
jgi:hypothetical protein